MIERLKSYWAKHGQKTLGAYIALLAGADLTSLTIYKDDIAHFIGNSWTAHVLSGTRLICGVAIVIRALQAKVNAAS